MTRRLIPLLLLLPACAVENPEAVFDTTGAVIGWDCQLGVCGPARRTDAPDPPDCDGPTELRVGAGAIALLCAVDSSDAPFAETCRPLACDTLGDCPQWSGRFYVCIQGICQVEESEAWSLDRVDLSALCLFDVPRHASCVEALADEQVAQRLALVDEVCEDAGCRGTVPLACLQP